VELFPREEASPQPVSPEPDPLDEPPAEAVESDPASAEPERPGLWPVDDPPLGLREREDVDDRDPVDLWPVDDLPADPQASDEDLDPPAAASSA
jgi:hypothetical protein